MVYQIESRRNGNLSISSGGHMFTSDHYKTETFLDRVRPGDAIRFGRYALDTDPRKEPRIVAPMEWTVLEKQGARLLLLNRFQIATAMAGSMDEERNEEIFDYRYSDVRACLREGQAEWFSPVELALIADTRLGADSNPAFGTAAEPDVCDKLFLLTADEVLKYFDPAAYARRGALAEEITEGELGQDFFILQNADADAPVVLTYVSGGAGENVQTVELYVTEFLGWWTRTPGAEAGSAVVYESGGRLNLGGLDVFADEVGVRPALWLDLSARCGTET